MKSLIIAVAALGLTSGAVQAQTKPAWTPTAEERADLQCMSVYALMANQEDQAMAAAVGILYFLGRLEGRGPGIDWLQRLSVYADTVSIEEIQAEAPRCGQVLVDKGEAMQRIGGQMSGQPAA